MEKFLQNSGGFRSKGKEIITGFQNLKSNISCGDNSRIDKDHVGVDIMSVINGAVNKSYNAMLTLDISLHVECGNEGKWNVLFSKINEAGPVAVKPSGENKTHSFKTMLTNGRGPRPNAGWKPKAHAGPQKVMFHKSNLQHITTKSTLTKLVEIQPSVSVSDNTVIQLPGVASSKVLSSLACNTVVLLSSVASSQPSVLGCHCWGLCPKIQFIGMS